MGTRISQLPPKGANLANTDLLMISQETSDAYESKSITGAEIIASAQEGLQPTLVSGTNIKTVNGNSLLGSGDLVVGGGLTIGTTAITSGTVGRLLFEGTGNVVQESSNLFWDNTNGRLGIGTSSPNMSLDVRTGNVGIGVTSNAGYKLDVNGTARISSFIDCRSYGSFRGDFYVYQGNGGGGFSITQTAGQSYMVGQSTHDIFMGKTSGYSFILKNQTRIFGMDDTSGSALTNASALLTMTSTTKGFLPPRMTNAEMVAIATPASGLMVYDTTNNKMCVYDGTAWQNLY